MKREVAEEWMSRYLDGDLNGEDAKELFRYMDENPDAAETFRIMTALSLRLEKLPDVKPRYSLVDAILPQLDELDAERRADSAAEIGIMEPQQESVDELAEKRRQRGNWRDRLPVRTIGGIVAAGLVLGISIANYEPKTLTEAGPDISPYNYDQPNDITDNSTIDEPQNTHSSSETQSNPQNSEEKDPPSNATDGESSSNEPSDGKDSANAPATSDKSKETNSTPTTPPQSESTTSRTQQSERQEPASGNRGGVSSGNDTGTSTPSSNRGSASEQSSTSANQQDDTKARSLTNPETSDNSTKSESSSSDQKSGSAEQGITSQSQSEQTPSSSDTPAADSTTGAGKSSTSDSSGSPEVSTMNTPDSSAITLPKTEQEWKSPTQDYTVVLTTDNTLRLDSVAADNLNGRSVVSSIPLKGNWISGKWSDDGKIFTYQVSESGISKTYKITVGS